MVSRDMKLKWFDRGAAAFERTFPRVLKETTGDDWPRYVCPICDVAFLRDSVLSGELTAEHVPPHSFGGRELLLTCQVCNNTAGTQVDAHARRRENIAEVQIATSNRSLKIRIDLEGVKLQARLEPTPDGQTVKIIRAANNPADIAKLLEVKTIPAGSRIDVEFLGDRYSELSANMSWFRSGYLALFALAGYRFSFDPATRIVKEQLRSPGQRLIYCFTLNVPPMARRDELTFAAISEPPCTGVMFGKYTIMFPRPGDVDFYQRIEQAARAQLDGAAKGTVTGIPYVLAKWEPLFGFPDTTDDQALADSPNVPAQAPDESTK